MPKAHGQAAGIFGKEAYPSMSKVSKWDHGRGPKEFTHENKSVASTGKSQHPKQAYIKKSGRKGGA
jgi:hypothetical protein